MAWDETSPAGTDAVREGDNAIRLFKTDVRTALGVDHKQTDGTAFSSSALSATRHKFERLVPLGYRHGLRIDQPTTGTTGNITLKGRLWIEINGDLCKLTADLVKAYSGLSASSIYYIYLTSPGHLAEITAAQFTWLTTVPTFSIVKQGWYNGDARCVGWFLTVVTSMRAFQQNGTDWSFYSLLASVAGNSATSPTLSGTLPNYVPVFGTAAKFFGTVTLSGADTIAALLVSPSTSSFAVLSWPTNGSVITVGGLLEVPLTSARDVYISRTGGVSGSANLNLLGVTLDDSL